MSFQDFSFGVVALCLSMLLTFAFGRMIYRFTLALKNREATSPLFTYDHELGKDDNSHWRRERLRRFGALRGYRHHTRHGRHAHLAQLVVA